MKNCTYILAIALLSCSFAYSDQESKPIKQAKPQHHRVYIGPDVFVDHAQAKYASHGNNIYVTSTTVFGGLRAGYDYLKPQSFYFGTDGLVAMGRNFFKTNFKYYPHRVNQRFKSTPLFANLEQRYGYTFQSPISSKSTLTPFAGIGWYYTRSQFNNESSSVNWLYGAAGLSVTQQFCENFDIGLNLKALYTIAGRKHVRMWLGLVKENIRNVWGYEVAMPFTWHVGESKKWDLQFQPYILKLDVNNINQILGARLQAGYSF